MAALLALLVSQCVWKEPEGPGQASVSTSQATTPAASLSLQPAADVQLSSWQPRPAPPLCSLCDSVSNRCRVRDTCERVQRPRDEWPCPLLSPWTRRTSPREVCLFPADPLPDRLRQVASTSPWVSFSSRAADARNRTLSPLRTPPG